MWMNLWQVLNGTRRRAGEHAALRKRHGGDGDEQAGVSDGDARLLSVHVCCDYDGFAGGFGFGEDEY